MDIVIFAVTLGLMYGLIAAGFALILGTSRVFDLCFGTYYMVGAYAYFFCYNTLGKIFGLFFSILVSCVLAWLIHRFILYRFKNTPILVMVVSSALAIAISECIILYFKTEYKYLPPLWDGAFSFMGTTITYQRILAGMVAICTLCLLWFFLNHTKQGMAIRAVMQHPEAAELVGVRPRSIHLSVVCIGAGLSALGSIMVVPVFVLGPHIWLDAILLAFAGVVVGGLGSVGGALFAMFIIAFCETLVSSLISEGGFFRQAVYVVIMVVILLVRPYGLFGKKEGS